MNCSNEKNKRILIVDDEENVLELLRIYLTSVGWEVTAAPTVTQAFEELKKQMFFMVITDIAMPEMDGYEFISEVKALGYNSRLAVMTGFGYDKNHTLIKINKTVKYPCLFKPFEWAKVTKAVNEAFEAYNN
jgi:DNA-binding NtrC family response regulator